MVRGSGPWWGDAENAQGRSDTFDLGAKTDDRGQVGGVGRAVGDQTPWGGIHVLWLLGPCSPSAPLCWVFPHASEFHRGTVSPMTARTQIFLDLINTLKIQ